MLLIKNKKTVRYSAAATAVFGAVIIASLSQMVHAATMGEVFVRFDRMTKSTATTGTVCVKPATTSTDVKSWSVTFPTGYTVSATASDWDTSGAANITTTNLAWPTTPSPTAWPGATTATASVVGQTVTWTNGAAQSMNNSSLYCYNWTAASVTVKSTTTDSNTGTVTTKDSGSVTIDSGSYATSSLDGDSIVVTATVPTAFAFVLSGYTDALGTLGTGAISSSPIPRTVTVNTNAKNGFGIWAKDSNAGLHSATASYTIPAKTYSGAGPTTVTSNNEGYNTGVTQTLAGGSGTLTVDPGFLSGGAGQGGGLTTAFHPIATSDGSADNAILTLTNNVGIKGSTPAATDYTDTITVVGAGLF